VPRNRRADRVKRVLSRVARIRTDCCPRRVSAPV
jgi:hypothetical protein